MKYCHLQQHYGHTEYYTKWSKSKINTILYHEHVKSKKRTQISLYTKQKQIHKHRKQTYGYQKGKRGWGEW